MVSGFVGFSPDEVIDAAPVRSLAMQWSYPSKVSALPQFVSFRGAREGTPWTGFDSLASTGLVKITTMESFEPDRQSCSGHMQSNVASEKQGLVRYTEATYPAKHIDAHVVNHTVASQTNLTGLPAVGTAVRQSYVAASGQHLISSVGAQPVPIASPVTILPSSNPVVGTTNLRTDGKTSGAPSQLTIFYNGSVCVYDNVSPEKAQAIMLLAGNCPTSTPRPAIPAAPFQASVPRSSFLEGFVATQPCSTNVLCSSPMPVTSVRGPQSVSFSGAISDSTVSKSRDYLISSNKVECLKVANTRAPSGTVPQFRRKSLARFLEKRKDRVISTSPFASIQSSDSSSNPVAGNSSLTDNSCTLPAANRSY